MKIFARIHSINNCHLLNSIVNNIQGLMTQTNAYYYLNLFFMIRLSLSGQDDFSLLKYIVANAVGSRHVLHNPLLLLVVFDFSFLFDVTSWPVPVFLFTKTWKQISVILTSQRLAESRYHVIIKAACVNVQRVLKPGLKIEVFYSSFRGHSWGQFLNYLYLKDFIFIWKWILKRKVESRYWHLNSAYGCAIERYFKLNFTQ